MSKDGKNFEKRAILAWLTRGNVNCPLTRQPLKPSLLVPNASLKRNIDKWRRENGVEDSEDETSVVSENDSNFFGLLQIDGDGAAHNNHRFNPTQQLDLEMPAEDDLSDLLDLYNEVLELTSTHFESTTGSHSVIRPRAVSPISLSDEASDAAFGAIVAQTVARRLWLPKLFQKKMGGCST